MAFWDDIMNWLNPPAQLAPGTEQKAANYLLANPSYSARVLANTTPYTQALVKQATPTNPTTDYDALLTDYGGGDTGQLYEWQQVTPWQQAQLDWEKKKWQQEQQATAQQLAYQQQQAAAQQAYQRQQLAYQQQQLAAEQAWRQQQLEAEKQQRLATLAAQPKSWLEYAAYANQTPVIQPWMMPLMPSDYGIMSVGQAIPNWSSSDMSQMPNLINPSAQYLARIAPSQQEQYYGYEQARTGATPEDTQWRLWAMGPPSGANRGLVQQR